MCGYGVRGMIQKVRTSSPNCLPPVTVDPDA